MKPTPTKPTPTKPNPTKPNPTKPIGRSGRWLWVWVLLVLAAAAPACSTVPAYQRAPLMERCMLRPFDGLAAGFDDHIFTTREAMAGATGRGGPACGCN